MSSIRSRHPGQGHRILAIALLGVLALSGCKMKADAKAGADGAADSEQADKGPEAVTVEVASAHRRAVSASYHGTAALTPAAEAEVAAKTSGIALQVHAAEGQHVRAGQALVRLDTSRQALQLAQSDAQLRKLEANYRRAAQLATQKMVSAADVDQLRYDLENARAVNRLARLELSYGTVTAPISGVVAARLIKPGNFVQINSTVIKLIDNSRLEATLNVPERDIELLRAGQPVTLAVDALPGRTFEGTITRIAPLIDAGSGTFRVFCGFAGDGLLQAGMFGRIDIAYDRRANALVIPRPAILEDDAQPAVFAVRGGKADRVPLKLGYIDGEWAEVVDGLKEGEQVVVAGKAALRDGSTVKVIGPAPAKAAATPAQAARQ